MIVAAGFGNEFTQRPNLIAFIVVMEKILFGLQKSGSHFSMRSVWPIQMKLKYTGTGVEATNCLEDVCLAEVMKSNIKNFKEGQTESEASEQHL